MHQAKEACHAALSRFRRPALLSRSRVNGGGGYPSETRVRRGDRIVHGDKELIEKLGRNDLCPCGSGKSFQEMLPALRSFRRQRKEALHARLRHAAAASGWAADGQPCDCRHCRARSATPSWQPPTRRKDNQTCAPLPLKNTSRRPGFSMAPDGSYATISPRPAPAAPRSSSSLSKSASVGSRTWMPPASTCRCCRSTRRAPSNWTRRKQ